MSVYTPAYRLTIYQPREVDNDESTVLTPAAGAPHSDSFKVASIQGVTGFVPYIYSLPTGRKGRFDPLTKKLDIGSISIVLMDQRTTSSNLDRWVTAFVGDNTGYIRLKGLKAYVEESLNGGSTWAPFFVGRIQDFSLTGLQKFTVTIREPTDELKYPVFVGTPHRDITYDAKPMVLPIGLSNAYANLGTTPMLTGTWNADGSTRGNFSLSDSQQDRADNVLTDVFSTEMSYMGVHNSSLNLSNIWYNYASGSYSDYKVSVYNNSTGVFIGSYNIYFINSTTSGEWDVKRAELVYVKALPSGSNPHPEFKPITTLVDGTTYKFAVFPMADTTISEANPLFLNNVHPVTFLKDIASGSFGHLYGPNDFNRPSGLVVGDRKFAFPVSASTFSALQAKPYPLSKWRITQSYPMNEFLEKYICQPYHIGYRIDPAVVSGNPMGVLSVFDARKPTSVTGLMTITEADLVAGRIPTWEPTSPLTKVTVSYYSDRLPSVRSQVELQSDVDFPTVPIGGVKEDKIPAIWLDNRRLDAGIANLALDAIGVRGTIGDLVQKQDGLIYASTAMRFVMDPYVERFADGPANVSLECLRTANTSGCKIGDWVIVDVEYLPNPQIHTRGSARIMQCTERSENGLTLTLRFSDSGENVLQTAPNVTTFVTSSADPDGTALMTYSTTVAAYTQAGYAITDISASSRPVEDDASWRIGSSMFRTPGTYTVAFTGLPAQTKVWGRARNLNAPGSGSQLPSAYDFPSGAGSVTMRALTTPTGLTISNISPVSAFMSWSNQGDDTSYVELHIASPATASLNYYAGLSGGTSTYDLRGLVTGSATNPYKVAIRHYNGRGSYSTFASASFTATGSTPIAPSLGRLFIEPNTFGGLK